MTKKHTSKKIIKRKKSHKRSNTIRIPKGKKLKLWAIQNKDRVIAWGKRHKFLAAGVTTISIAALVLIATLIFTNIVTVINMRKNDEPLNVLFNQDDSAFLDQLENIINN